MMLEDHTIQLSGALSIPPQYVSVDECCNFTCSGLREYAQLWYIIQAEQTQVRKEGSSPPAAPVLPGACQAQPGMIPPPGTPNHPSRTAESLKHC